MANANAARPGQPQRPLEPIKQIKAGVLDVGYCEMGASDGTRAPRLLVTFAGHDQGTDE